MSVTLNPQLADRIWKHTLTHVEYSIRSQVNIESREREPAVFFRNDLDQWTKSEEFTSVNALAEACKRGELQMKFTPKPIDLEGVRFIFNKCGTELQNLAKTDSHQDKRDKGKIQALKMVQQICIDYFSKIEAINATPESTPEQTQVVVADAATDVSGDESGGEEDAGR